MPDRLTQHIYPAPYHDRCAEAVDVALDTTPAYRSWRPLDPGRSARPLERVRALPWLTKSDLRAHGVEGFVPSGKRLEAALAAGEIELVGTSGSTGDRVTNIWYQPWWDASESASWHLHAALQGAGLGSHREAILTSPYCTGYPCEDGYLSMEKRLLDRFLYLSERPDPASWTEELMDRMLRELRRFRPVVLEANPSFLARLSRHVLARGTPVPDVGIVTFTYENPSLLHYRLVREAFGTEAASSYGSTEAGYVFMECEAGRLHQNTASCHVDFLPLRPEHGGPAVGRILVTTFGNPWRSLVRFDVGDVVRLGGRCPCGRNEGLTLHAVEGRVANLTMTPDGRAVTQAAIDREMSSVDGLVEYQVLQTAPARYELAVVPSDGPATRRRAAQEAGDRLRELYGSRASVSVEAVEAIRPDPPGKYRLTKSALTIDAESLVEPSFLRQRN